MNRNVRIGLLWVGMAVAVAGLVPVAADAWQGGRRMGWDTWDAGEKVEILTEELGLSHEQAAELEAIFDANQRKVEAARTQFKQARKAFRQEMREMRRATDDQLNALLTPEQRAKYAEFGGCPLGRRGGWCPRMLE